VLVCVFIVPVVSCSKEVGTVMTSNQDSMKFVLF